jgi:hypothetical protein
MEYILKLNKEIESEDVKNIYSLLKSNGYEEIETDNENAVWIPYEDEKWGDKFLLDFKNNKEEGYLYIDSDRTFRNGIIDVIESFFKDDLISLDEC